MYFKIKTANEKEKTKQRMKKEMKKAAVPPSTLTFKRLLIISIYLFLYSYCLKPVLLVGFVSRLFARLEWQRLGKLQCNAADKAVHIIDSANMPFACKAGHIKTFVGSKAWNTEAGCYFLTFERTTLI
jgi:hypothetical protein